MINRIVGLVIALWLVPICMAEGVLSIQYRDKPPYSYEKDGKPAGFLIERTVEVLRHAAIDAEYVEVPIKRIVVDIKANKKAICSPGWYRTPEREGFAQFSLAIHKDKPHIVLANANVARKIKSNGTLKELLSNKGFVLGRVVGVSYGPELDAMMNSATATVMSATVEPGDLARMIATHRADYMLIDVEDYNFLLKNKVVDQADLTVVKFDDIPAGLTRYIMCSKNVSAETMRRINKAIQAVLPDVQAQ